MSEPKEKTDLEHEQYAYRLTRKLFYYTAAGTFLFSAIMVALWYII